jgi:phosphatidylglycerol:prolipoprotein diacylglycerol transferase
LNRIAFTFGSLEVHWYGIFAALAVFISYKLTRRNTDHYGLPGNQVDNILLRCVIGVIVGARIGFVLVNLPYFIASPLEIIRIDHGGLGSHGAIITVMILGILWVKRFGFSYWQMADAIAPSISVAHIFVRSGNFMNGELYGTPTNLPWGVRFPGLPGPVHPVQLYEAGLSLLILPLVIKWSRSPRYHGYAFLRVIFAHSLIRFLLDFDRRHSGLIGPFVLTQIIALAFVLFSVCLMVYLRRQVGEGQEDNSNLLQT